MRWALGLQPVSLMRSSLLVSILFSPVLWGACQGEAGSSVDADLASPGALDLATPPVGQTDLSSSGADLLPGTTPPLGQEAGFVWQGFEHAWLRTVLGFAVPHRVSRLDSFLDGATFTKAAPPQGQALFHFGQDTGVDGNYMKPIGHFAGLGGQVFVRQDKVTLSWSDDATGGEYPRADSAQSLTLRQPLDGILVGGAAPTVGTMVLSGIALLTSCDDAKQPADAPCNSDGMWPYRMRLAIGECTLGPSELACPLDVQVGRAWTPNKGGLPPLEEKPFNDKLDFSLTVHYAVWLGGADGLVVREAILAAEGRGHDQDPKGGLRTLTGTPGFAAATVGIHRFGFELGPANDAAKSNHLGRYIGALRFHAVAESYRAAQGELDVRWATQVWLPDTVEDATVAYELGLRLLATNGHAHPSKQVQGSLCSDSKNAPFFSTWQRCDEAAFGPAQTQQAVQVLLP